MNNAAIVWIHGRHSHGFSGHFDFARELQREFLQTILTIQPIVRRIQHNLNLFPGVLIGDAIHQILHSVQCCAPATDQKVFIIAMNIQQNLLLVLFDVYRELYL